MRTIAIIGSGAVGSYYGARIAKAGYDVRFLMRTHYQAVKQDGLFVHSVDVDFHLAADVYDQPEQIGPVDLVICALKTTSLDQAESLLRPVVADETRILALMNGLGVEERIAQWFRPEQVLGGLAFVCINRGQPGHVHHTDYGKVTIGDLLDDVEQAEQVGQIFRNAGIEAAVTDCLKRARWEKLLWNIPFNTLSVTAGSVSTQQILADPNLTKLLRLLMDEVMASAAADGMPLAEDLPETMINHTKTMGHYRTSMAIDFDHRRPLETQYILGEPIRRAEAAGLDVPYMRAQLWLACFLDKRNRGLIESADAPLEAPTG